MAVRPVNSNEGISLDPLQLSFSYLDSIDVYNCRFVCKAWNSAIDSRLMREAVERSFQDQKLYSNRAVVDAVERFVNSVALNQTAKFTCVFQEPPNVLGRAPLHMTFWLELNPPERTFATNYDIKQDYVRLDWDGDRSLPRPLPREYVPKFSELRILGGSSPGTPSKRDILYNRPPFRAVFLCAPVFGDGFTMPDLDDKIIQIMQKRVDEFVYQRDRRFNNLVSVVAPILTVAGSLLLKSYFS